MRWPSPAVAPWATSSTTCGPAQARAWDLIGVRTVSHGVDREQFRSAWNSFGVRTKLERARQLQQDLGLQGVPTFVVDGRYITAPSLMGTGKGSAETRTLQVVDFLIAKAAKERKAPPKR